MRQQIQYLKVLPESGGSELTEWSFAAASSKQVSPPEIQGGMSAQADRGPAKVSKGGVDSERAGLLSDGVPREA